jgi:asparagine synthetase A
MFIENNCFNVDVSTLSKFNIYMYDGNHTNESHYNALLHFYNCLDDTFIFIVDDWNWKEVRDGTLRSIEKLNLKNLYSKEIRTTNDDTHPAWGSQEQQRWHNGIYVSILQK